MSLVGSAFRLHLQRPSFTLRVFPASHAWFSNGAYLNSPVKLNQHARKQLRQKGRDIKPKTPTLNVFDKCTVVELAEALDKPAKYIYESVDLINSDLQKNAKITRSTVLSQEITRRICLRAGHRANFVSRPTQSSAKLVNDNVYAQPPADLEKCKLRPPVVTIMGHVDHGKTTLLDQLRKSRIVDQEFGGITQHIGAFSVPFSNDKTITFLDTPGHAAFSAMRGRGAKMTDIVVLVVGADDGVMPQTEESIDHARHAKVPLIVAINKIDKEGADVEICKEELALHGVILEEAGGDVQAVEISALKGTNIDALQEAIITQAELLNIRADHEGLVEGIIIEAKTDPGRGKLASVLVQRGTLEKSKYLVTGQTGAKVRSLFDENRKQLKSAGPGQAIEVIGWKDLPSPGDEVLEVTTEQKMKQVLNYRKTMEHDLQAEEAWEAINRRRQEETAVQKERFKIKLESGLPLHSIRLKKKMREIDALSAKQTADEDIIPVLSLVIKADVDGSQEAIMNCLQTYSCDLCKLDIITAEVGMVTENDVEMASAFDGVIMAFNTKVSEKVDKQATDCSVQIRHHNVIYKLFDDVKNMLNDQVPERTEHKILGEAVVQQIFNVKEKIDGKNQQIPIAGCRCIDGKLLRNMQFKLVRDNFILHSGRLYSLKHFKDEVDDIKQQQECGLAFDEHSLELEVGDTILCYEEFRVKPTIEWTLPF